MLGGDATRGGFPYGLGQTPGSAGFPLGTLGGAQGGLPPGVRGGLPTASAPQQGRYAAQALQSNLAQLGSFQARQGALAAAGLPPPTQGPELSARRGALMAAGLLPPNFSGPLPAGSIRDSNDPHIRAHLDSLASSRGTPPGPLARGAAAANLQAPAAPAPPVVSQGMHPQAFHQHLAAQAALNSYPAAAGTSRLNGSSMQQLQNTGRMGAGLGGSAAVNLLHQGAAMPGISAAPPTSLAPSQDLLSLLSRQKQGGGLPVSAAPPAASAAMSMPTSDPFAALRKGAVPPPGVDGFSILNEEFPALPGSTARTDADPGPPPFSAPAAAAAASMSAGLAPPPQPPQPLQPTTARGGFALMPSVSGADAAYGGGSAGGDAALRAQKAAAAASLSGMDYERLLRFQHAQQQHAAATASAQGGAPTAAGAPIPPPHHALPVFSGASDPRGVRGAGGTAAAAAVATATGLVLGGSPDGGRLGFTHLEGPGGAGGESGGSGSALGPLQAEEGRRGLGLPDRFGLLGLMPLLKMSDADLTMLSLGTDLTSLGLNLNSSDNLHKALVSPLADVPVKTPEPEFELPACYKHTPQRLQPGYLTKFKEETLFYIFYSMPGDEAQLIAADELSCRGWLYHKRLRMWLLHVPGAIPQKSARGERGSFVVFNHTIWEAEQKPDMEILYDDLEKPPRLVRSKTVQQQQQQPHPPSLMMQHAAAAAAGMPASSGAFPPGMQPTPVMQ